MPVVGDRDIEEPKQAVQNEQGELGRKEGDWRMLAFRGLERRETYSSRL
jgi:hypothetical protein